MALIMSRSAAREKKRKTSTDLTYESAFAGSRSASVRTDWSDDSPVRSLRRRTMRQEHPYRADKVEHNLATKGIKASESDLEERLGDATRPKPKSSKRSAEPTRKKLNQRKRISSVLTASPSPEVFTGDVTARSWLEEGTKAYVPVTLNMTSVGALFDKLEQSWELMLDDRKITHCIVSFSWLEDSDNIFLLRSDDGTAYGEILKEAKGALVANDRKRSVNIHISAK